MFPLEARHSRGGIARVRRGQPCFMPRLGCMGEGGYMEYRRDMTAELS